MEFIYTLAVSDAGTAECSLNTPSSILLKTLNVCTAIWIIMNYFQLVAIIAPHPLKGMPYLRWTIIGIQAISFVLSATSHLKKMKITASWETQLGVNHATLKRQLLVAGNANISFLKVRLVLKHWAATGVALVSVVKCALNLSNQTSLFCVKMER